MKWLLVGLMCLSFGARADILHEKNPVVPAVVGALLAADMLQSLSIRHYPWGYELNPILGPHPSDAAVVGYFAVYGLAYGVAYKTLSPEWAFVVSASIVVLEANAVVQNHSLGYSLRF